MEKKLIQVPFQKTPERLDIYLSREFNLTRAKVKNLLEEGNVFLNGRKAEKAAAKVKGGEMLEVFIPPPKPSGVKPEAIPLEILYEDKALLAINKPPGLVVHPAAGHWEGTLVNALVYHFGKLSGIDPARPGIVHRLDKDTSGVLLVAKTDEVHLELSRQLKEREIEKYYQVLVHGKVMQEQGVIEKPVGRHPVDRKKMGIVATGRCAVTRFKVLKRFQNFTLLECKIETGRTHQIRVHLSSIRHPVVGDLIYGKKDEALGVKRQMLHAWKVIFKHPVTRERLVIEAPLPDDFQEALSLCV